MPASTDKFEWIKAVRLDQRLTTADRYVLQNAALEYVNYRDGDDSFYARQTTMAERFGVGLRTVQRAIAQGKKYGYLVVEQPRRRGRGYHDADFHRLVIPQLLPANQAGNTDADMTRIPANQAGNIAVIPANLAEIPANQAEIPANAEPSTCGNDTPKGWLKRVKNKGGQENKGGGAFSDENAMRNDDDFDDYNFDKENAPLRSASLEEKQELALVAELLCVRCGQNPRHFLGNGICGFCMADDEAERNSRSNRAAEFCQSDDPIAGLFG